jgi:hypothetical protein
LHDADAEKESDSYEVKPSALYFTSEIETEQSFPVRLAMMVAIADSRAEAEISFTEVGMAIPIERLEAVISRFAVAFPRPTEATRAEMADVWHKALSDFDESDVIAACGRLMKTLTRFPFPADVINEIKAGH